MVLGGAHFFGRLHGGAETGDSAGLDDLLLVFAGVDRSLLQVRHGFPEVALLFLDCRQVIEGERIVLVNLQDLLNFLAARSYFPA